MKYLVANPIYDSVFKFLMEDERIAKTILSALLKKEVVSVEMRRHEHPNTTRDKISMFRIDFAAKIREDDGSTHMVLIELQKTWLDTETLRFRRYLAAQYNAEENMVEKDGKKVYALPMIAIYLLGHRVGDIDKAVIYVTRKALDYEGNEIANGQSDPFINSLSHDSIIVQIPLLHGNINNRLDKVLSVFDQTKMDESDQHLVCLDMSNYQDDSEMMYIVHRLGLANMSAEIRQEMNDEDEYFSAIEARDTQLMELKQVVSQRDLQINQQNLQINQQNLQINQQNLQINQQNLQIKAMATAMLQNGMSIEAIAQTIGKTTDEVKALVEA